MNPRTHTGDQEDSPSMDSLTDIVFDMDVADNRNLIEEQRLQQAINAFIKPAVIALAVILIGTLLVLVMLPSGSSFPDCQLSSKPTLESLLAGNSTLHSKTFSTNAILKSDHQFIDLVENLTIKFSSATNDSSKKAIIVECGDISKVLTTSKKNKMDTIIENAIIARFGSDFNRAKASLDGTFPLELRLRTNVCDSILESKGKLLLSDEIERSWYRRKILAPENAFWTDNVTIHWTGLNLEEDQTVSCMLTKQLSDGNCNDR